MPLEMTLRISFLLQILYAYLVEAIAIDLLSPSLLPKGQPCFFFLKDSSTSNMRIDDKGDNSEIAMIRRIFPQAFVHFS